MAHTKVWLQSATPFDPEEVLGYETRHRADLRALIKGICRMMMKILSRYGLARLVLISKGDIIKFQIGPLSNGVPHPRSNSLDHAAVDPID